MQKSEHIFFTVSLLINVNTLIIFKESIVVPYFLKKLVKRN